MYNYAVKAENWLTSDNLTTFVSGYTRSDPIERLLIHMALDLETTRREYERTGSVSDEWMFRFARAALLQAISTPGYSAVATNAHYLNRCIANSWFFALCELS